MIQLNYFHFSILLFGWNNKKFHNDHFWATFINFNFFWPNLKIEIRGQFVNFKYLRGQNIIFKNFEGPICNFWIFIGVKLKFLENLRTKMQNLKNCNN